jgi:hypothetical protein
MRNLILISSIIFSSSVFAGRKDYHTSLISLASSNKAKQMCSCLFVMHQKEEFCDRFSVPDKYLDYVDSTSVDTKNKEVKATVALFWKSSAKYVDDKRGCQLQGE